MVSGTGVCQIVCIVRQETCFLNDFFCVCLSSVEWGRAERTLGVFVYAAFVRTAHDVALMLGEASSGVISQSQFLDVAESTCMWSGTLVVRPGVSVPPRGLLFKGCLRPLLLLIRILVGLGSLVVQP